MSKLSANGLEVLKRRYLAKDENGRVVETPEELFYRVANAISEVEKESVRSEWRDKFYRIMSELDFLPNSPTLMNAGQPLGQLSACFVLPVHDSMDEIFTTIHDTAMIHKSGGGTGFSFSQIRAEGANVASTGGCASGPISFMRAFDAATGTVAQGGCFVGGTLVMTSEGPVKIQDLKKDMLVLSKNHDGADIWTACTDSFLTRRDVSVVSIQTDMHGAIECTPDHPFMVEIKDGQYIYKKAIELQPGDMVINSNYMVDNRNKVNTKGKARSDIATWDDKRTLVQIDSVDVFGKTADVWNVEVPGTHNYAVCALYDSKPRCAQYIYDCVFVSNTRRGANMGLLRVDHPDIMKFITAKNDLNTLNNFNMSVGLTTAFMMALKNNGTYELVDPHTHKVMETVEAKKVYDAIVESAWKTGEPGIIFLDRVNSNNFLRPLYGDIEATNPCLPGDTPITILEDGKIVERCIEQLVGKKVSVWNGYEWSEVTPRVTGHNEPLRTILFSNGRYIRCTLKHKFLMCTNQWKEAHDLRYGDVLAPWKLPDAADTDTGESVYVTGVIDQGIIATDVYCLTEPKRHTFMANGVVVGNCGEQPLLPYESCNLGSINLANFVLPDGTVDYARLGEVVRIAVRFLDDVIDVNKYPLPAIDTMSRANRKIGLGVMGFADMLQLMYIPYDAEEAFNQATSIMRFIQDVAHDESSKLAGEKGAYPSYHKLVEKNVWSRHTKDKMFRRNAFVTTIAPTGSISAIAGVSSGIEPLFANVFYKHYMDDDYHAVINERLLRDLEKEIPDQEQLDYIVEELKSGRSILDFPAISERTMNVYRCAHDISPKAHIMMQSCFQKYVDNAISKTVNFNHDATKEEIAEAYKLAYDLGCKGVTVYRDGCRENQTLNLGAVEKKNEPKEENEPKVSTTVDGTVRVFLDVIYNLEVTRPKMAPTGGAMMTVFDALMDEMTARAAENPTWSHLFQQFVYSFISGFAADTYSMRTWFMNAYGAGTIGKMLRDAIQLPKDPMESKKDENALTVGHNIIRAADEENMQIPMWNNEHVVDTLMKFITCPEYREWFKEHHPTFYAKLRATLRSMEKTVTDAEKDVKERPDSLDGTTTKVKINCGKLYVTTNHDDDGNIFEVFSTNGKSGGCPAQSEAVCRLVSLLLRAGVSVDEITRQICGIKCMACVKNPDVQVLSCPDAIGRELKRHFAVARVKQANIELKKDIEKVKVETEAKLLDPEMMDMIENSFSRPVVNMTDRCPECGAEMKHIGGCKNCLNCGYSSCG